MTDPTETGARDVATRIEDALRGTTPGPWLWDSWGEVVATAFADGERTVICNVGLWFQKDADGRLIAAAPSLLRDALARFEADAATIAALREANANQAETIRKMLDRVTEYEEALDLLEDGDDA